MKKLGYIVCGVVCLMLVSACVGLAESPEFRKPNIVILFADDMGYGDLGSYGHPYNRTPNLDDLASEGQRWTDFYVAAPVCSPSRGALLTGKLPTRTGLYGRNLAVLFPNDDAGMPDVELTMAEALKTAGYSTAIIGKWHLGDAKNVYPTRHGFDYWYGLPYSNDMDWVGVMSFDELMGLAAQGKMQELQKELASRQPKYLDPKIEYWSVPLIRSAVVEGGYTDVVVEKSHDQRTLTKRYTQEAINYIERNKEAPFLLYLAYNMPHTPLFRSEEFSGVSRGGRYGDVMEELDWSVGKITAKLDDLGIANNTLVIFVSDNGPWLTMKYHSGTAGLLKQGKGTTYEGGMRVPAIFSWPGKIESAVVSDMGSTLDIYSTVLSLAGVIPPADIDGLDLTDTLLSLDKSPRNSVAFYRAGELRAFRKGDYKLRLITEGVYNQGPKKTLHEKPMLYNLSVDPSERYDIANANPEVVKDLLDSIQLHRASMVDKDPIFDQRLHK